MTTLSKFFPQAHPTKEIFRQAGIPVAAVAKFLNLSSSYTCSLLNGFARLTSHNERMLNDFARLVEGEVKEKK